MNKVKGLLLGVLCFFSFVAVANAASVGVKASNASITKGQTVTFTVTVSSNSPMVSIEGSLSCSGAGASGGVDLTFDEGSNNLYSKTYTYKLKASQTGTITCQTSGVRITSMSSNDWQNLANSSVKVTVKDAVVIPPKEYSSNNNLNSLSIEGFELDKKFDKDTLEYNVEVPNDTTKVNIKASVADNKASVKGAGEIAVSEGSNKLEVKVTAENGNVKTYIINVTVKELDPIEVSVGDKKYTIIRKEGVIDAPDGFEKTTIKIDDEEVLAYKNDKIGYTLVGLKDADGNTKYYIYDNGKYSEYNPLQVGGLNLIVLDYPKDKIFEGYTLGEFEVNDVKYKGYRSSKKSKFYIIYAKNIETGKDSLYQYDASEGTIQKYNSDVLDLVNKYKQERDNYKMYFIITLAVFGIAILATIITFIVKKKKGNKKVNRVNKIKPSSDINF